jgi:hypothetical protein
MFARVRDSRDQHDSDTEAEEEEEFDDLEAAENALRWKDKSNNRRVRRQNCCFWVVVVVIVLMFIYHTYTLKTWRMFFRGNYVNVIHDHVHRDRPKPRKHGPF